MALPVKIPLAVSSKIHARSSAVPSRKRQRREGVLPPCRVTNTEQEMVDPREPYAYDTSMINIGPQYQVPNPELGPLERRVDTTFLEGIFSDKVSVEDTNYWFAEPDGGWDSEDVYAINLDQVPTKGNSAVHYGPGRIELSDLEEGAVMTGEVIGLMLNHGVQVDLGAQFDGLIPVKGDEWMDEHFKTKFGVYSGVSADFEVGQTVTVQIYRINHRARCRFPIQLVVLFPDVSNKLSHPDDFIFPFDLRGVKSYEEAYAITGRELPETPGFGGRISKEEMDTEMVTMREPKLVEERYGMDFTKVESPAKDVISLLGEKPFTAPGPKKPPGIILNTTEEWYNETGTMLQWPVEPAVEEDDDVYVESY